MALVFRDYQTRQPRDSELIDEGLKRLHDHLLDDKESRVEYEIKSKDDQSKLGGQPGVRFDFACNDADHVPVRGECTAMTYRGVAYWFFTWAPVDDADGLRDEWAELRAKFTLENKREGWTEKPPNLLTVQGNKLPYKLDYAGYDREKKKEGLWEKQELDGYDPHADLVLLGYDPKDQEARQAEKAAAVQVLALDKAPDLPAAVKEAKEGFWRSKKKRAGDDIPLPRRGDGRRRRQGPDEHGQRRDRGRLQGPHQQVRGEEVRGPQQLRRSGRGAHGQRDVLAVVCECGWDRRDLWEQEFTTLLARLRPAKGNCAGCFPAAPPAAAAASARARWLRACLTRALSSPNVCDIPE